MASLTTKPSTIVCPGHSRPVVGVHYIKTQQNQSFLLSAALDSKPMLRSGLTGDWIGTFEGHKGAVWSAKMNRDATKAATGSGDFTAKIWDAIDGSELLSLRHKHIVKSVEFSKDSSQLLTGARDKQLRLFDLNDTTSDAKPLICLHPKGVTNGTWTNDANLVISGCDDGILRTWDLRTLEIIQEFNLNESISDIEMSQDGELLAIAAGKQVVFLNTTNPASFEIIKKHECKLNVESISVSPNQKTFLTAGTDLWVHEYNFETFEEVDVKKGHHGPVHCVKYSPDGDNYASGADDATLRIWSKNVGK